MIIQNTNPVVAEPEIKKVTQGMLREDLFISVHEQFMIETAAKTDIVSPVTMVLNTRIITRPAAIPFYHTPADRALCRMPQ